MAVAGPTCTSAHELGDITPFRVRACNITHALDVNGNANNRALRPLTNRIA